MASTGTFSTIINGLKNGAIVLSNGSIAYLTRQAYANLYSGYVPNPSQFYATININISNYTIDEVLKTSEVTFTADDILTATDWIVINEVIPTISNNRVFGHINY